ncbi:MAG: spore coat protein U domain-containing protein [Roseiarcus sp.]|jgi:spore coat protein U domain-containing protein, fimbrial subunit CupE1/2/3/6
MRARVRPTTLAGPLARLARAMTGWSVLALPLSMFFWVAQPSQANAALTCSIGAAGGNYGSVDVLTGAAATASATFTISCTGGTAGQIAILCTEFGQGSPNASSSVRYMGNGAATTIHELYTSAALTTVWGSWGYGTAAYGSGGYAWDPSIASDGTATATFTVYGQFKGSQTTAVPGTYTWTNSTPVLTYAQAATGTPCTTKPTGSKTATAGASNWTVTVIANCYIGTAPIAFGTVGLLSSAVTAIGYFGTNCSNTWPYTMSLSAGSGPGATVTTRYMTNGASTVAYSLYQNSGYTTVWGSTIGTDTMSSTGTGAVQLFTIYGKAPSQSTPPPGSYSDTVVATITF